MPARRSGNVRARSANASWFQLREMSVRNGPGITAFTRTFGAERVGEAEGQRVQARLRRGVGEDVVRRPDAADRGDVDDRAAVACRHAGADERGEPERPLQVHREHLVPELLGDALRIGIGRRDPRVVDEDVDPPERCRTPRRRARRARPSGRRGRRGRAPGGRGRAPRRPPRRTPPALRLETTTSAPARARLWMIARPSPRVPPVMRATRPVRSKRSYGGAGRAVTRALPRSRSQLLAAAISIASLGWNE